MDQAYNKMNESKKIKNDYSSSSADNNKTSLLPEKVQIFLQSGMTEGYYDGHLNISSK